jgi:hypothetical protein
VHSIRRRSSSSSSNTSGTHHQAPIASSVSNLLLLLLLQGAAGTQRHQGSIPIVIMSPLLPAACTPTFPLPRQPFAVSLHQPCQRALFPACLPTSLIKRAAQKYRLNRTHLQIHCRSLRLPAELAVLSSSPNRLLAAAPFIAAAAAAMAVGPVAPALLLLLMCERGSRSRVMMALLSSSNGRPAVHVHQTPLPPDVLYLLVIMQSSVISFCAFRAR